MWGKLAVFGYDGSFDIGAAGDVDLEQYRRVVRGSTRRRRRGALECERDQFKFVYKRVDDPAWIVLGDEVIETFWKQRDLLTVLAFDKSHHRRLSSERVDSV
ncbi:hypothetical protein K6W39_03340 [Burkholderia ambifaria]|nr:hypothetical protein [Burkholderia ambifaria]